MEAMTMPPPPQRTILVVDDEPRVLDNVAELCEAFGYRVLRALDSQGALRDLDATIHLMITDVRMPGLDGADLLRQARSVAPALPVIVMTGYRDADRLAAMLALGVAGVLWKPFTFRELTAMIDRALAEGRPVAPLEASPTRLLLWNLSESPAQPAVSPRRRGVARGEFS